MTYSFSCGEDKMCPTCSKQPVAFLTRDIEEAYLHSRQNNVPMWIVKGE